MGIHKLMDLLKEKAPGCIRKLDLSFFGGRIVAVDASMAMYQFLVQTQGVTDNFLTNLTDAEGNRTGHLVGLFHRTILFLENGIKPVWVFDGKPPQMKNGELARRKKMKEEAKDKADDAKEVGDMEEALKQIQRTTSITRVMKEDAIKMLKLMGIPVVIAPCEAEAQCAVLCKAGKVYATVTEDMDALTFATKILLRGVNNKKEPIYEINYDDMLKGLEMTYDEFVDLCILCGCDYTDTIQGVGPITAFKLMKEHGTIEKVIEHLKHENENGKKKNRYGIPEQFLYEDSRDLFKQAQTQDPNEIDLKWLKPDEEQLKKFLCGEKGFAESRIDNAYKKIKGKETQGVQMRLESFFGKPTVLKSNSGVKQSPKKKTTQKTKKIN